MAGGYGCATPPVLREEVKLPTRHAEGTQGDAGRVGLPAVPAQQLELGVELRHRLSSGGHQLDSPPNPPGGLSREEGDRAQLLPRLPDAVEGLPRVAGLDLPNGARVAPELGAHKRVELLHRLEGGVEGALELPQQQLGPVHVPPPPRRAATGASAPGPAALPRAPTGPRKAPDPPPETPHPGLSRGAQVRARRAHFHTGGATRWPAMAVGVGSKELQRDSRREMGINGKS